MMTPAPHDVFSAELFPGEKVQWTGRPNPSVIFHPEDALLIPFSLLWGGFAIFWLIGASGMAPLTHTGTNPPFNWFGIVWGTPFVLVGQYMIWGRFLYNRWQKKRTSYALTNRRALIVQTRFGSRSATSAYFANLSMIDRRVREDGIGSISFGGTVEGTWQLGRKRAPRAPTFDDVDHADEVYRIAERWYDEAHRSTQQ